MAIMGFCRKALLLLLLAIQTLRSEVIQSTLSSSEFDEDESDSVAYMVVIEHEKGRRCAGALVSLRTALTSARCVRLSSERAQLWALAAAMVAGRGSVRAVDGARRVVRLAFSGTDPTDPTNDLALLAIEEPFGEKALSRPILMATAAGECDAAPDCNTVRALSRGNAPGSPSLRLRVINVQRVSHEVCTAHVPHWAAYKERSFCLKGETLCENDVGGGVVCASLLCGVISVVGASKAKDAGCGDTFGALSVARWRRFLHCAHTQRLCGRGDCESLCTEQWLDGSNEAPPPASLGSAFQTHAVAVDRALTPPMISSLVYNTHKVNVTKSVVSVHHAASPRSFVSGGSGESSGASNGFSARMPMATRTPFVYELRPAADFEPNRADFKAGEYGDNALEYGAPLDEGLPPPPLKPSSSRPVSAPPTSPRHAPLAHPQTHTQRKEKKEPEIRNAMCIRKPDMGFLLVMTILNTINR